MNEILHFHDQRNASGPGPPRDTGKSGAAARYVKLKRAAFWHFLKNKFIVYTKNNFKKLHRSVEVQFGNPKNERPILQF